MDVTVMKSSDFLESIESFNVSFGGKNSIDAESFYKIIDDTVSLVKASANAVDPSCFIKLEIKANEKGSFKTVIDVITRHSPDLLYVSSVAKNITQGFINYFEIKRHLKGKKAKKVNSVNKDIEIYNQSNEILRVPQNIGKSYFENSKVDNSVINITNNVYHDRRDDFCIETENKKFTMDKSEYRDMSASVVDEEPVVETVTNEPIDVKLLLKKPDLLGDSKWEFMYIKKIAVKICDENFLEKLRSGKIKLSSGVRIPCKLQVEYDLDANHDIIEGSDRYSILEVTGDIIEPDQDKQDSLI